MTVAVRAIEGREEWNALALQLPHPDFRQSWEWGALRARRGWRPLRLAAFSGEECLVAMSILGWRVTGLGTALYAPRGPMLEPKNAAAWEALPALLDLAHRLTGAVFLRVSPHARAQGSSTLARLVECGFRAVPDLWSVWNTPRNLMQMDITGSERDLLLRMAPKRRQHISSAHRRGVRADIDPALEALQAFYPWLVAHAAARGYPIAGWPYVRALHEEFAPGGRLAVIHGRVGDEIVTTLVGIRFGPVAHSLYAAGALMARNPWAGDLAHWHFIRWARDGGCVEIDFGSTCTDVPPAPDHPNYGIYRFKLDLGARLVMQTEYYDYVFAPVRYRVARQLERNALPSARRLFARAQVARLRRRHSRRSS